MKYECPTCNEIDFDLERAYAERDALRARLAEVEAGSSGEPLDTDFLREIAATLREERWVGEAARVRAAADAIDALRAALAEVTAELAEVEAERDSAEARLVPVVELINSWWDKPGSLTYDEAFTAVEAALSVAEPDPIHQTTTPAEVDQ